MFVSVFVHRGLTFLSYHRGLDILPFWIFLALIISLVGRRKWETWRQMSRRNWGQNGMACFAKDDQMDRIDPNIYFFALRLFEYSYGYYSLQIYTYIISNTYIISYM